MMLDHLAQDLRYAARALLRSPGFAALAVLCLGLGIGVNTSVFSIVHAILFRPLPFPDGERIVSLYASHAAREIEDGGVSLADLEDMLAGSGSLQEVGGLSRRGYTLTGGDLAERVQGAAVTPNLFSLLGVAPQVGRSFRPEEAQPAGFEPVVILGDALWRRSFAADPGIVGRTVHLNGRELEVVGVMPPGFRFPETEDLWLPLGIEPEGARTRRFVWGIGKLRPGATVEGAQGELDALARRLAAAHPATHREWGLRVVGYRDDLVDPAAQRLLYVMLGAVAFVLLIACANVANLLLVRGTDRQREIALRAAVGASRARIVRQLLTESVLVALAGGALGTLISVWWVEAMVRAIPEEMAYWIRFAVDGWVLLYTLLLSLVTGLVFGALPALRASRPDLHLELKEGGRTSAGGRERNPLRAALVTGEIALSLVLVVGAALMVQSFLRLQTADAGFATGRVLSLRLQLNGDRYDPIAARAAFWSAAAERIATLPGVEGAVATTTIPADDSGIAVPLLREGDDRPVEEALSVAVYGSSAGLWSTLRAPLLAGRDFTPQEVADSLATVVIVGRTLAERLWPDGGAVGSRIRLPRTDSTALFTVIGVAPDLQYTEFAEERPFDFLQLHLPYGRMAYRQMAILVGTAGSPASVAGAVRGELARLDPLVAPFDLLTMGERRLYTTWPQRVFGITFGIFGVIALVLAVTGVYGVTSHGVARRRREIGIRMALGAHVGDVLRMVVGQGARLALVGVAIGLAGAAALTRLLGGILYGVGVHDPWTFAGAGFVLAATALLASYLPARRAARVDPMVALRSE